MTILKSNFLIGGRVASSVVAAGPQSNLSIQTKHITASLSLVSGSHQSNLSVTSPKILSTVLLNPSQAELEGAATALQQAAIARTAANDASDSADAASAALAAVTPLAAAAADSAAAAAASEAGAAASRDAVAAQAEGIDANARAAAAAAANAAAVEANAVASSESAIANAADAAQSAHDAADAKALALLHRDSSFAEAERSAACAADAASSQADSEAAQGASEAAQTASEAAQAASEAARDASEIAQHASEAAQAASEVAQAASEAARDAAAASAADLAAAVAATDVNEAEALAAQRAAEQAQAASEAARDESTAQAAAALASANAADDSEASAIAARDESTAQAAAALASRNESTAQAQAAAASAAAADESEAAALASKNAAAASAADLAAAVVAADESEAAALVAQNASEQARAGAEAAQAAALASQRESTAQAVAAAASEDEATAQAAAALSSQQTASARADDAAASAAAASADADDAAASAAASAQSAANAAADKSVSQHLDERDASNGYAGLTLFKLNMKNALGSIISFFTNANTAARTYTLPDKSGTVAMTSDITGTNSGVNTGDETTGSIKTKLGIATLSGANTGDETAATISAKMAATLSGTNTGDETTANIKAKLGITTLSGVNTGDETAATISTKMAATLSGTNTGDETGATIKTKLGIATLSGANTGDETAATIGAKMAATLSGTNTGDETAATISTKMAATLSGTNTGDETGATIKTKLGIATLSGANTGDETAATISAKMAATLSGTNTGDETAATISAKMAATLSGTNTGDETAASIKTKLGIATLSGANTGDQTLASLGIPNVNNTSDANKPVSTAQQTALDAKLNLAGGNITGNLGIHVAAPVAVLDVSSNAEFHQIRQSNANGAQALWSGAVADSIGTFIGSNARYSTSYKYMPNYPAATVIRFGSNGALELCADTGLTAGVEYVPTARLTVSPTGVSVAGGITATTFTGALAGNASSATKLTTARTINGVAFDGTANITVADSTKIATSLIGAANGVVPLAADSKIAAIYLPSYVDDVVEFANLAAFPATGASGVMYIAIDSNKTYRWGGTVYTEISASPGSTDAVPEGATNQYFTVARVLSAVAAGLSTATNAAITAADTVLGALGKLQAQITARAMSGANSDITSLTGLTTALSVAQGGTGATTGAAAMVSLGFPNVENKTSTMILGELGNARTVSALGYTPPKTASFAQGSNLSALSSVDLRTVANPLTGLGYPGGGRFRFGHADDISGSFADIIDLSTYIDSSGGGFNALYLNKASQLIQHKWAAAGGTAWTAKTLAYTDSNITGNAATATKLTTARTINGVAFDGTANITVADSTKYPASGGALTGPLTAPAGAVVAAITSANTAPIGVADIAAGAGGFAPGFHMATLVTGGYRQHITIGGYRAAANSWTGGIFFGLGGSDTNPTEYFLMGYGGAITHSNGSTFLNSGNFNTYAPTLAGVGATGTWPIGVTGNAGTATSAAKLTTARTINGIAFDGSANIALAKADIGMGSVDNTSDAAKPVSTAQQAALDLKAPKDSPLFTGGAQFAESIIAKKGVRFDTTDGVILQNIAIKNNGNTPNGYIKFVTPIKPSQSQMFSIDVVGYDYNANKSIDFTVVGYAYSATDTVINIGFANRSTFTKNVRLALEDRGAGRVLVIAMGAETAAGASNEAWYFQKFSATVRGWAGNVANWTADQFSFVTGETTLAAGFWETSNLNNLWLDAQGGTINAATSVTAPNFYGNLNGNAVSANSAGKLTTARTINGVAFDGSANITLAKADIALGNVDNTSDANKPVSTAQAAADALKQDTAGKDASGGYVGLTAFKLNLKNAAGTFISFLTNAATAARTYTFPDKDGTVAMLSDITGTNSGVNTGDQTLASLGIPNVNNTSDANKPVSTAQQAALDLKANIAGPTFTGTATAPNFAGNLTGYKNVDNVNEMTLANGFAGGILNLNYRGATAAITEVRIVNGMAGGVLTKVVASNIDASGNVTGNAATATSASTATKLTTARTINGVAFDGTANITVADSTKVATTLIGAPSGIVPLGADSKIPATYLPSYVDDVLEFANLAALPATGETGKMYVTLDLNKTYRWGGTVYTEISASPGSTDAVPEGATNQYFTVARVLATVAAGLSTVTNAAITAADTVLSALGKLQKQITDLKTGVGASGNWAIRADQAYLMIGQDTRSVQTGPNSLSSANVRWDFKANGTDGLVDGGSYHGALTLQQWSDGTGGGTRQLGFTDNDNMWIRGSGTAQTAYGAWKRIIDSTSIGSYSPTLTGVGASGTWAIDITGRAVKASTVAQGGGNGLGMTFNWASNVGGNQPPWVWGGFDGTNHYVYNPSNFSVLRAASAGTVDNHIDADRSAANVNTMLTNGTYGFDGIPTNAPYGYGAMMVARNSDTGLQVAGGHGSDNLWFRGWSSSGSTFTAWRSVWHSGNMNAPAVSAVANSTAQRDPNGYLLGTFINMTDDGLTGGGGTVSGIITKQGDHYYRTTTKGAVKAFLAMLGSEVSTPRTDLNSDLGIGRELRWMNYGNGHTIFDASKSLSPVGSAVNNTNATVAWSATYPTLMGWNGSQTYGVRVDSARIADTASRANWLNSAGDYAWNASWAPSYYGVTMGYSFVSASEGFPNFGGLLLMKPYSGTDGGALQMYVPYSPTLGGNGLRVRFGNYDSSGWTGWKTLIADDTIGSYNCNSATYVQGYGLAVSGNANSIALRDGGGALYAIAYVGSTYTTSVGDTFNWNGVSVSHYGMNIRSYSGGQFNVLSGYSGIALCTNGLEQVFIGSGGNVNINRGALWVSGDVTAFSDERIKTNWRAVDGDFVAKWAAVKSGIYDRTDITATQAGLSAQSVRNVLPQAVFEREFKGDKRRAAGTYLSLNYGAAAAIASVELAKKAVEMERKLDAANEKLDAQNSVIESLIKRIEAMETK